MIQRIAIAICLACLAATPTPAADPVSRFGEYEGYSVERYAEWADTSRYLEMRDGVRLAIDITMPAVDGKAADGPFPVVWTHSRYHRNPGALIKRFPPEGMEFGEVDSRVDVDPGLQRLVRHGYVVVSVQVRGGGASFGRYEGLFSDAETGDAYEVIDWLSKQPWSNGAVGMFGKSYLGVTQYMAASRQHPALKAIFPNVAGLDMYDTFHPGGVYRQDMIGHWGPRTRNLDVEWPAPPVDDDPDGEWLAQAIEQHRDNWDVEIGYAEPYRDFKSPELTWARHGPSGVLDDIRDSSVPAYHFNGWFDIFVLDTVLWWANYRGPQKMTIGAWPHAAVADQRLMEEMQRLTAIERHRWFDHWLKGIDNGVMDEPPIHYALMIEPGSWEWRSADRWPTTGTSQRTLYLAGGPSGTAGSVNDGNLLNEPPTGTLAGHDTYQVDPTTTTGTTTRWDNAMAAARFMSYPDMSDNDAKSMTWTTGPLDHDLAIVGHPVVTLYIESTTGDADIVALLEEVDAEGRSHYVTEGVLRASHRKLGEAPWDNLGLPYQRSYSDDVKPLPDDGPAELRMDLHPTATVFNAGHRLRLTVMGADADNLEAPASLPTLRVHRNEAFPSRIDLPALSAGPPPN